MHEERGYVARFLRSGAVGYVLKRTASSELLRAIRAAANGRSLLTDRPFRRRATPAADGELDSGVPRLTSRASDVLHSLALGHRNTEIVSALSIGVRTVETHRATGMSKLGPSTRAAPVRVAMREGWLALELTRVVSSRPRSSP